MRFAGSDHRWLCCFSPIYPQYSSSLRLAGGVRSSPKRVSCCFAGPYGAAGSLGMALAMLWVSLACGCSRSARRPDDALVVVLPRDAQQLDPRLTGDTYGVRLSRLIFASLVTIDPRTLDVVPDLAQEVQVVSPTCYRVELKGDARFSDGSRLTSEDVLATYRSLVAEDIGSRYARTFQRIARMQAPDEHTVVFHLSEPHATFLTDLEMPILRAEDEHRLVGVGDRPAPVGAGPYRLRPRVGGSLVLEANPNWHHGTPRYPLVRMVVVRDDNTRALRLLAGAADLVVDAMPPLLLPLFEQTREYQVRSVPGVGTTYLGLNLDAPALADPRVRRAIAHAVDRAKLVATKLGGRARLAHSWIAPGLWAHSENVAFHEFDPERSRKLLDAAGFLRRRGQPRMRLTLRVGADRFRVSLARAISAMLAEVGLDVDVRPTETATLLADLNRGRFQMTLLQVPEVIEPHVLSWFFTSQRVPDPGRREGANRWRFRNAEFDAAIERGRSTPVREARYAAYQEAQRILAEKLPVIPLWHDSVVAVAGPRAKPFEVARNARFDTLAR